MKTRREELVMIAFRMYGDCIGTQMCREETKTRLIAEYDLTEEESLEIVELAVEEWIEAYR